MTCCRRQDLHGRADGSFKCLSCGALLYTGYGMAERVVALIKDRFGSGFDVKQVMTSVSFSPASLRRIIEAVGSAEGRELATAITAAMKVEP